MMACEYCTGGDDQKSIGNGERYGISVYLNYYVDEGWYLAAYTSVEVFGEIHSALEEVPINYCPKCGDRLGDGNE